MDGDKLVSFHVMAIVAKKSNNKSPQLHTTAIVYS